MYIIVGVATYKNSSVGFWEQLNPYLRKRKAESAARGFLLEARPLWPHRDFSEDLNGGEPFVRGEGLLRVSRQAALNCT